MNATEILLWLIVAVILGGGLLTCIWTFAHKCGREAERNDMADTIGLEHYWRGFAAGRRQERADQEADPLIGAEHLYPTIYERGTDGTIRRIGGRS